MNEMKVFNNAEFGKIRTLNRDGEPWFVGKDVATALGVQQRKQGTCRPCSRRG